MKWATLIDPWYLNQKYLVSYNVSQYKLVINIEKKNTISHVGLHIHCSTCLPMAETTLAYTVHREVSTLILYHNIPFPPGSPLHNNLCPSFLMDYAYWRVFGRKVTPLPTHSTLQAQPGMFLADCVWASS